LALLTNADRGGLLTRDLTQWALKTYLGATIAEPQPIDVEQGAVRPILGVYRRPMVDIEIGLLGGRLIAQMVYKHGFPTQDQPPPPAPPPMTLAPCAPDRLLILDGPMRGSTTEILRRPDGSIGWLRAGGRIHLREDG
jgi:hypothetical protein